MRIGFYTFRPFHDAILRPVYDKLEPRHRCMISSDIDQLADFQPHVVVLSESIVGRLRPKFPGARFVHTRHGLAAKQVAYQGARETDYLCVTSNTMKQWYLDANASPKHEFWTVGYVQMDPLFRVDPLPLPIALPDASQVILYAPTYNPGLSSVPMLGEKTISCLRGQRSDIAIVIKPHPLVAKHHPQWIQSLRNQAATEQNVFLIEDAHADIMPYLRAAGVLVTDASSVQLEYLATLRPMVLINNPDRFASEHFDPNGFEWKWRDMGVQIDDVNELSKATLHALHNPADLLDVRTQYRDKLFGNLTDGHAVDRLAEKISALDIRFAGERDFTPTTLWPVLGARRIGRKLRKAIVGKQAA